MNDENYDPVLPFYDHINHQLTFAFAEVTEGLKGLRELIATHEPLMIRDAGIIYIV